ncbi:MAG: hypothetical protein GY790_06875 [Bacteroidetes bacterium]|nr:hypothetical protein [Bacteroidota bacterium]
MIFFILFACESGFNWGIAQDYSFFPYPWIQEINLPEHFADIPNESFYLDNTGTLFLGKANGLSVISESNSYHLQMEGPVYVSGNGSDTIYYACKNDMGFLLNDRSGKFTIRSQKDRIARVNRNFTPSRLICTHEAVFINTNRGVYHYWKGRIQSFPFPGVMGRLHLVGGRLVLRMNQAETYLWTGRGFRRMTDHEIGLDPALLIPGQIELREGFKFYNYLANDESIAISGKDGLVILDQSGKVVAALGKREGLSGHDIRQVSMCDGEELWILGAYSLHKINHPSTLEIIELRPETYGRIYVSEISGRSIFLGTSHGLFVAEPDEGERGRWNIRNIAGDQPESFLLMTRAGNQIFAAGSKHLVTINNELVEAISERSYTGLQAINQELVVAAGEKGLSSFQRTPAGWISKVIDPALTNSFSFALHNNKVFLICNNSVQRLSDDLSRSITIPLRREDILHKLVTIDRQLYLITDIQVYRYEESEETFLPVEKDHKARILSVSDIIIPDENGGHWMVLHQGKYRSSVLHETAGDETDVESRSYPALQNLGEIIGLNIRDSVLCLTGMDKVVLFNTGVLDRPKVGMLPRIKQVPGSSHNRSHVFQIAGLDFQSIPEPEFRFRLVSGGEEWSDWSRSRKVVFTRLKPGSYTLFAQAKDLYGSISGSAEIQFNVKAPFYRAWYAWTFYGLALLIILFLIRKLRLLNNQHIESRVSLRLQSKLDDLTLEKEKSDKLVADILPDRTAEQIKSVGKAKWDKYERTTVLFSDIQGFTKIAEEMNPEALIDELDQFFFHFDSVVEKYNIEKIKTIGDAYMAAGGIPEKNSTNPVEVVLAALEMQSYMKKLKSTKADIWDLRIGVHTGPVIAGVVGHKKVSYDIWGDTVNTASRMESSGMPGKVNISGITYGMVKDYFLCEYRGKLPVKYKGNIDMYFVTGLRPELSVDLKEIPNKRFYIKLQLLRLGDLEDRVFETILVKLPGNLHFHCKEYARKLYNQSFLLCRAEEIEQEDRLLVRTAALMLYTGLTQAYSNFENRSSVIAREILPQYKYSELQIDKICNLILATKIPFQPINQLEKILIDTKMEYIGRPDYPDHIKLLFQEMVESGANLNGQQFKKQQLELLYTFDFFTVAARRLREVPGEEQQTNLEQERWI